jgi:Family of unknown function (DUF5989)
MTEPDESPKGSSEESFDALARQKVSSVGAVFGFFASTKKWWLLPPLVILLLLALLFALSTTVGSPFIYTIF